MNKLLLIDGHSILSRAYYGIPLLTASTGVHTNAVYGFLNILFKCIDEENADNVAVAFDPRGFGKRRERSEWGEENILSSSCYGLAHMAESLGLTLLGLLTFDAMRIIDYLEERKEWGEIRAIGFSGGGMQTLYLAALTKE